MVWWTTTLGCSSKLQAIVSPSCCVTTTLNDPLFYYSVGVPFRFCVFWFLHLNWNASNLRLNSRTPDDGPILCGSTPGSDNCSSPRPLLIISGHPSVIALIALRSGLIFLNHQPTAQYPWVNPQQSNLRNLRGSRNIILQHHRNHSKPFLFCFFVEGEFVFFLFSLLFSPGFNVPRNVNLFSFSVVTISLGIRSRMYQLYHYYSYSLDRQSSFFLFLDFH
jgi:hypothetical protein